ncbi:hypothetical protein SAMN04490209_0203 [Pseudomonas rhodesiae]|uniref:Uncharacterized protein n=1 Tax=Pseudomonas rhodesiae TaxID=76760 RepID=A0AAE8KXD1_9PSED|nr:hypothetical protein SAMN04490209_0203 [Pseudomonas rhodesiae]
MNPSAHGYFAYRYARDTSENRCGRQAVVLLCAFPEFVKRGARHRGVSMNGL